MSRLLEALAGQGIAFCQWKGAAALERALRGERDLDGLVRTTDWQRALAAIEAAGWKRGLPRSGRDEPGVAHFFAYEPSLERLLHLHLHDRLLSGEDWINSHALPFEADFLASTRRLHEVPLPASEGEAALAVLKHAIRWGSLPDRLTLWLRPKDEAQELEALLVEPALSKAAALVHARCPALDEATFRACALALLAAPDAGARRRLSRQVRRALRPWSRYGPAGRARAYLQLVHARLRRLLDRSRQQRGPARGPVCFELVGDGAARAAAELALWLGPAFRTTRRAAAAGEELLCVGAPLRTGAPHRAQRIELARFATNDPAALRAAVWEGL